MNPPAKNLIVQQISEQEYLASEPYSEVKREYIDGSVNAMAGAKASHNRITGNVFGEFYSHLKGKPCQPYPSGMKIKVGHNYFYPDVLVDCASIPDDSTFSTTPVLIVEVLSKSTRQLDKTVKRHAYSHIATLQEYALVEQDVVEIELWKKMGAHWEQFTYYLGDTLAFDSIGLGIAVEDIYDRVQNADVTEWLEKKAREAAEALAAGKES